MVEGWGTGEIVREASTGMRARMMIVEWPVVEIVMKVVEW